MGSSARERDGRAAGEVAVVVISQDQLIAHGEIVSGLDGGDFEEAFLTVGVGGHRAEQQEEHGDRGGGDETTAR
jgi:hypothetical protein